MTYGRIAFPLLTALLAAGPMQARELPVDRDGLRADAASRALLGQRQTLGLDQRHAFDLKKTHTDELGMTHAHFQQTFNGVRVWGGDVITHTKANGSLAPHTNALKGGIDLNTVPSLKASEALASVDQALGQHGAFAHAPSTELVIYPITTPRLRAGAQGDLATADATQVEHAIVRYALAYHVHTAFENATDGIKQTDFIVDAHTGAILKQWNNLHTSAAVGTGKSQYSGTVSIATNSTSTGFEMRDMTRGSGGTYGNNIVTDGAHVADTNSAAGKIYTNSTNTWGDGQNYVEGSSDTAANGQTAAVDAMFGMMTSWDFYKNVLGRNGIDGNGTATYSRVHISNSYDNAFWDDTCFCMTYGDGSSFTTLTSIDVAGHEMSHGVIANSVPGGLNYSGESGGLNESNSDIFGTMIEYYDLGGGEAAASTTVPATGGNFTIGEQLSSTPLRYMYKPSLDGSSPDAWSSTIGNLDVHYSSGPGNRAFYFLAQGATTSGNTSTTYLPSGMTGVGNDHATRIHYRAMTTYYTSTETYAQARAAHISAAKDLYGAGSPEEIAVWNAFHGINVGAAWTSTALAASITTPSANVTVASGSAVSFAGAASGGTSPYTYSWTFGDGGTASTASASHTYTNTGSSAVNYTATFTVTDSASHTASATRVITVNPAAGVSVVISPATATVNTNGTQQFSASVTGTTNTAVTWSVVEAGGGSVSSTGLYTAPATAGTYHVKVTSQADATKSATATVTVNPISGSTELILNGGFESGATSWTATSGVIGANGSSEPAHGGSYDAWMCGYGSTHTDSVYQAVAIPSSASSATLSFWLHIDTAETTTSTAYDTLKVQVRNSSGTVLATLATYSNLNKATGYAQKTFDLSAYKGQTVQIYFVGTEDSSLQTSFVLDDVSVKVQ